MSDEQDDDERVGYCRPPRKHQFKPGQSGNPRGRKKGSRSLTQIVNQQLSKKVRVGAGGRARTIEKREVVAIRLIDMALKGDHRAMALAMRIDDEANAGKNGPAIEDDTTEEMLKRFLARKGFE